MKKTLLIAVLLLFIGVTTSHAQTISYPSTAQNLTVCNGESTLTATVTGADTTTTLSLALPPGVEYVANSFIVTSGTATAVEGGSSNVPTFALTNVSDPFTFTISRKATCASYSHALSSGTFKDAITIGTTTDNDPLVNFYQVTYPTVTVSQPAPLNNVAFGSTHTRNFTFQNNGQGCLDTAYLEIDFGTAETTPNGSITADGVVFAPDPVLSSGAIYVYKIFGTPTFAGGLCDTDPPISISQPVIINGCSQNPTSYKVGWGCAYSSQCQIGTSNGNITVQVTIPNLTAVVTSTSTSPNCAGSPYATITAVITNTGNGGANNVSMTLGNFNGNNPTRSFPYVVDTASIQINAVHPDGISVASDGTKTKQTQNTACSVGLPSTAIVNPSTPIYIPVNGSITVTWDVNICPGGACDDAFGKVQEMGLELDYTTECGVAATKAAQGISNFGIDNKVENVISQVPAQVIGGSCFSLKIDLDSDLSPSVNEGYMEVTIPLPAGMSINNLATDVTENLAGNQMHMGYPKQVGQDVIARFTPGSVNQLSLTICTTPAACGAQSIPVDIVQAIDSSCAPNELKTRKCISVPFDVVCPAPCASGGVVPVDWSFARSSYGLPDNDQNGNPDNSGSVDLTKIDVNRYQAGDTLRSFYKGYVKDQTAPGTITNWNNLIAEWKFNTSTWRGAYANVTIQRGTTTYVANGVPITDITAGSSFICNWDTATFTPALPATYIQDDSVTVEAFLIWSPAVKSNIPIISGTSTLENLLGEGPVNADAAAPEVDVLTHTVYAAQTVPTAEVVNQTTGWTCFIPEYYVNLIGDRSFVRANIGLAGSASGCADKTVGWRSYASRFGGYHGQQYFLYEFRPMRKQDSVVVTIPAGWEYVGLSSATSTWRRTRLKGSSISQSINTSIPTTVSGNSTTGTIVTWDLKNAYDNNIMLEGTEGSLLEQRFVLRPSCSSPATVDITVEEYGFWSHYPDSAGNPRPYYSRDVRSLTYGGVNKPDVVITNNSGVVQATSVNDNYWDIQLTGGNNNNAPNVWLAIEELTASNLTINNVEHPIGTTITPSNNYGTGKNLYQINAAGLSNPSFEIVRIYFSKGDCATETLKVRTGWDCSQFPTNADSACASNDITLTTTSATSEIQIFKTQEPALSSTVDICQPINYELRVRSTQNGDIDNPIVNIIPPPGMQIVANSFTYSYPGNNNPETFTVPLVGGKHELNLEDHSLIDTIGIPGVANASNTNERTAFVSYQLAVSSCSFVSGSTAQFEAKANGICGDPATGDGLIVNANPVRATPQAPIPALGGTLTANSNFVSCSSPTIITSVLTSTDGATYVGDSIFYYIPAPLQITPGSFVVNAGVVASSVVGTNQIKLELPANTSNAPSISFEVESTSATNCDTTHFDIQSEVFRSRGIDCPATFGNCQFAEKFDTDTIDFQVKKPNLNSQNFTHNQLGNTITYSMDINNSGNDDASAGDYLVNIYCGGDATGTLLHSFINSQVNASAAVAHNGSFTYNATDCPNGTASLYVQIQDTTTAGSVACICATEIGTSSVGTPLPVQLISFTGNAQMNGSNRLSWKVAQELNLSHYELQRMNLNNEYESVSVTQPISGFGEKEYLSFDAAPYGKDYYRLKVVDHDNKFAYSDVVSILNDNINDRINLYPNPAQEVLIIRFASNKAYEEVQIQIMDAVGKVISTVNKATSIGTNDYPISVKQLAAGTYFVRVIGDDNVLQQLKFTKTN